MKLIRKKVLIFSLVLVVTLGVVVALSNYFTAEEGTPPPNTKSVLTISVIEAGSPGVGLLTIKGDCPEKELVSQAGAFHCSLESANTQFHEINSLIFQSFTTEKRYSINLQARTVEAQSTKLKPGAHLDLLVNISKEGKVEVSELVNGRFKLLDPRIGPANSL